MMLLCEFKSGQRARLLEYGSTCAVYRRKLLAFGLTKGIEITVIRVAPMGCPIEIEVLGTCIALRKEDSMQLKWELL